MNALKFLICIFVIFPIALWFICYMADRHDFNTGKMDKIVIKELRYIEFDGHEYVISQHITGRLNGITHSPNCKCLKKETTRTQTNSLAMTTLQQYEDKKFFNQ